MIIGINTVGSTVATSASVSSGIGVIVVTCSICVNGCYIGYENDVNDDGVGCDGSFDGDGFELDPV